LSRFDPSLLQGGIFSHLSPQQIEMIATISSLKRYDNGEIFFMKVTKAAISIFCSKEKPAYSKPPLRPKRSSFTAFAPHR